jgi:hypothetical protein
MSEQSSADFDLRIKMRFERQLQPKLSRILTGVARDVSASIASNGAFAALAVNTQEAAIEAELLTHYRKVGKVFSRKLSVMLPSAIGITGAESAALQSTLEADFVNRAKAAAQQITKTTRKNIVLSVNSQLRNATPGISGVDNQAISRSVGTQLSRNGRIRSSGIALTETQATAELSKSLEADALSSVFAPPTKVWVSQGDSRVRDTHIQADGQEVSVNDSFIVGGASLMYPGDPSGPAREVVNCRCSSVVNEAAIISSREA